MVVIFKFLGRKTKKNRNKREATAALGLPTKTRPDLI